MATLIACGSAYLTGVASHILYFNKGEHHLHGVKYIGAGLLLVLGGTAVLNKAYALALITAFSASLTLLASGLAGLFTSLIIYRLFLNPLNRFPGPYWTRLTSLYWSFSLGNMDAALQMNTLHAKYGRYVRIGPSDLSIVNPEGMEISYGVHAKATKSAWYDGEYPHGSMHSTRDRAKHDRRRRIWSPAFSVKALQEYEKHVDYFNHAFLQLLKEKAGQPVNATRMFMLWSFDVMGRLAFGKDYGMLATGKRTEDLNTVTKGIELLAFHLPAWLLRVMTSIPGLAANYHKGNQFCLDELTWRVKNDSKKDGGGGDIMGWILKAYKDDPHPEKDWDLVQDAKLVIIAGSDTTAATFGHLFYYLAKDPEQTERIRAELRAVAQGPWTDKDVAHLPLLNGAINEALRLHPPVPSGVERVVPSEGMRMGDTYIPGGTKYRMPQYVLGRDSSNYPDPDAFIPDRWSTRSDLLKNKEAFAPFSMGPYGCIGKQLAYMELRTLTARILLDFDVQFAPGEDGTKLLKETLDHFTITMADLDLVFRPLR